MNTHEKASLIRLKVAALLEQCSRLEKDLENMRRERDELKSALENQTKTLEKLEDQNKIVKLAEGIQLNKQDRTEMKQAINHYVREIDECLKLLNQIPDNN